MALRTFLSNQGYDLCYVTEYGIVNNRTSNLTKSLGIFKDDEGLFKTNKKIHVDPRIATHPDIYMCQLGLWNEAGLFIGDPERLGPTYPDDVLYNCVCTKNYVIHLMENMDIDLMDAIFSWHENLDIDRHDLHILGTHQGYARCMCLPVDDNSFITSDDGIARVLEVEGAEVLQIEKGHIKLPGFDYGFIGGCAGNIYVNSEETPNQRAIVFNGDLSAHPDFENITSFIKRRNILPIWFDDYELEDIGSIIAVE